MALALEAADYEVLAYSDWLAVTAACGRPPMDAFVREFPIGLVLPSGVRKYRADFYRCSSRLVVELKGMAHVAGHKKLRKDTEREGLLVAAGLRVLPVDPDDIEAAVQLVRAALSAPTGPGGAG